MPPLQTQWHQNNQSLQVNFSGQALLRSTVKCPTWHECPTWMQTAITELRTCYQPERQVSQLSCENQKGISQHGKTANQKEMGILESKERPKRQWDCHGRSRLVVELRLKKKGQELLAFTWHLERMIGRDSSRTTSRLAFWCVLPLHPPLVIFKNKTF